MEPRFSRYLFESADALAQTDLSNELGDVIRKRLEGASDFHNACYEIVDGLRRLGHDLWSVDEGDDFQAWGPNYHEGIFAGLELRLSADGEVAVAWNRG